MTHVATQTRAVTAAPEDYAAAMKHANREIEDYIDDEKKRLAAREAE